MHIPLEHQDGCKAGRPLAPALAPEVYRKRQDAEYISDFDREIKRIEGKKP
jgi:hypothetical protein